MERNSVKKLQLFLVLTHITPVVKFKVEKAWRRYCFYILVFSVTKVVLISGFLFHTQSGGAGAPLVPHFSAESIASAV